MIARITNTRIIISLLRKNGFKCMERFSYANDMCGVVFNEDGICIATNEGDEFVCDDMFQMIGFLTYYGFMNKNYKQ